MALNDLKTLDVKDPQIIRHFPADVGGFFWHHRVLLEKCRAGVWIGLTPDGDLEVIDLTTVPHLTLDRKSNFPAAQAPYTYAFDLIGRSELEQYRRRAKTMNNLFNDSTQAEVDELVWVVADVSSSLFGTVVAEDLVDDGVTLGDSGIIQNDGEELYVKRIGASQLETWVKSKDPAKGDARLLGDHTDSSGKRYLDFHKAVDLLKSVDMPSWGLQGPRVVKEFLHAVREGSADLTTYHLGWARNSGISSYSAAVHEHRVLCDVLRILMTTDQVDVSSLLGVELLTRRVVQIETAVARNPVAPDYTGLEIMMEQTIGSTGEALTMKFNEWVGGKLKERAQVQKQARLYKEEFGRKTALSSDGAEIPKGKGRGRGQPKGKPTKGGGDGAAASSQ